MKLKLMQGLKSLQLCWRNREMEKKRLGELVSIRTGKLDANKNVVGGEYPFFTCSIEPLRIDTFSYDCECILVAGNGDLNVKYYKGKFDAYQRTYIIENVDDEKLNMKYLYFFLDNYVEVLRKNSIGGVIKYIKLGNLTEAELQLPSIVKQRRIVSILEKAKKLIDKRKEQIQACDELIKSQFIEMFGNFVYEKDRWDICEIGDVAQSIDPQPSHRTPPVCVNGIPYIGIADCNYEAGCIDFDKARKVSENVLGEHRKRYSITQGDFIIGKIGTIGKPFLIPEEQEYTLSANTVLIRPNSQKVNPSFLFTLFQSEYMDRIIDGEKKSTSQPAFGIQKVRKIEIPLPPIQLQNEFAQFVQQTNKLKFGMEKSLQELQDNFDSLMQRAFKGELF